MKILKKFLLVSILLLLTNSYCFSNEKLYYTAPTLLPGTSREMKTAGFWISRHPCPDKIIMTPVEVAQFNSRIQNELKLTKDITQWPTEYPGQELKNFLENKLNEFQAKGFYGPDGHKAAKLFFNLMKASMNLDAIPTTIKLQYGFVVHFADQRHLPTEEALYEKSNDIDFDELQNSDLDVGTPVAILHKSLDEDWFYVETDISSGWVKAEDVALGTLEDIKKFVNADFEQTGKRVVVTNDKGDIFLDETLTDYYDYVRMGNQFPYRNGYDNGALEVVIPMRMEDGKLIFRAGFMKGEDIHEGFLSYTSRNIIEQAFKLLNEPYGWGGMYGEQDCSRFLIEVFSTVGINLPRNSKDQARVGRELAQFKPDSSAATLSLLLKNAVGAVQGMIILTLKGHIMLYLGMVDDRHFAIHATWAYREKGLWGDRTRVINRVAVTDLSLGKGTKKKSWLERLLTVNVISNSQEEICGH